MCFQQIMVEVLKYTPLAAAAFAAASAIASAVSSGRARQSIEQAQAAYKYQKMNEILDSRYHEDMFRAKKGIAAVFRIKGRTSRKDYKKWFYDNRREALRRQTDIFRNRVSVYFTKVWDLYRAGVLKDDEIGGLVNGSDVSLLFHALKPLNEVAADRLHQIPIDSETKAEPGTMYEFYKRLYLQGKLK